MRRFGDAREAGTADEASSRRPRPFLRVVELLPMSCSLPLNPRRLRPNLLALACVAAALVPAAHAQTATDLDAVRVNAYRAANSTSGATKTSTALAETPQSVSVIERAELDARGVQSLNDAMRYVAGVSLESSGIDNRVDDFRIRGFDAGSWSNNVTLDGMRAPQGSQWNRSMFDSWNLERVEVLKGPSAVMYGQVAPGGMVNQVSKTPMPDQAQQLRLGVDANGQYSAAFDVGAGTAGEDHLFRLVGLYRDGQTQIKRTEQQHWFLAPSYTWQLAERTRLTLLGMYQKDDGGSTYQFLPAAGTLNPTASGYMKNSTFIGEPDWNTFDRTLWTAGWMFEQASPALSWSPVPDAKSYALIMEDPDAANVKPFVHWVAYNIPATEQSLPEGLPVDPRLLKPEGMLQGVNSRGSVGYFGPKPPVGDRPHHYHFQLLALDTVLDMKAGATRDEVLRAAKGHVLGVSEIVGTYQQTAAPLK